jgi:hypothetical protein
VLRLDSVGNWVRVYPAPTPVFGEMENRFEPGAIHTLPRPVVLPNAIGGVSFHPGFDVPSDLASRVVWFLAAVREPTIDAGALAEIDALLGAVDGGVFVGVAPADLPALAERTIARFCEQLGTLGFGTEGPFRVEAP